MHHRIELTPTYILHSRPFRDTSLLLDLFTQQYGLISVVARSARGSKSRYQGQLQLFTPMLVSWTGAHELKTLGNVELNGMPIQLNQKPLFCGFYLNELLMRLLHKEDSHPALFDFYHQSLCRLEKNDLIPVVLRLFEKKLLNELGYGLPLEQEAKSREKIHPDCFYRYEHQHGFILCEQNDASLIFSGSDLMLIAEEKFDNDAILQTAKRLTRTAIQHLLGNKKLHSREFF